MHAKIAKASRNSRVSRFLSSKIDKETIAGWQVSLERSVRVFDVSLQFLTLHSESTHPVFPDSTCTIYKHYQWPDK